MHSPVIDRRRHERLLAIALLWLAVGSVLLLTTLVPAHTALLGWAPLLWLFATPLTLLLIVEPGLLRQLLAWWRTRPGCDPLFPSGSGRAGRRRDAGAWALQALTPWRLRSILRRNSRITRRYSSSPRCSSSTPASMDGLSFTSITTGLSPTRLRSTP